MATVFPCPASILSRESFLQDYSTGQEAMWPGAHIVDDDDSLLRRRRNRRQKAYRTRLIVGAIAAAMVLVGCLIIGYAVRNPPAKKEPATNGKLPDRDSQTISEKTTQPTVSQRSQPKYQLFVALQMEPSSLKNFYLPSFKEEARDNEVTWATTYKDQTFRVYGPGQSVAISVDGKAAHIFIGNGVDVNVDCVVLLDDPLLKRIAGKPIVVVDAVCKTPDHFEDGKIVEVR